MAYVVTEDCVRCKYMDCVVRCPVNCFYEGENMLVINPDECIDCAACEPYCPANAIVSDGTIEGAHWLPVNRRYAGLWPRIVQKGTAPSDADLWLEVPGKFAKHFNADPGTCHLQPEK